MRNYIPPSTTSTLKKTHLQKLLKEVNQLIGDEQNKHGCIIKPMIDKKANLYFVAFAQGSR